MRISEPIVSVVTPVYNGGKYLAECIESVLSQTYQNWEYIIVNNCSTDATLEIAERYAATDRRIRLVNNSKFVNVIENHNIGLNSISNDSKYCKVVCADDWIYPECISRMVELGERYPSAAVIGAYSINNRWGVMWVGISPDRCVLSGRDACRSYLFGGPKVIGPPSSVLYRSEVVRERDNFFPGSAPSGDIAVYFELLRDWDFAFVHQILSFERVHEEALSAEQRRLNAFVVNEISFVQQYGAIYGTAYEQKNRLTQLMDEYYAILAHAFVHRMPKDYWVYQTMRMREIGLSIDRKRIGKSLVGKVVDLVLNPKLALEKTFRAFSKTRVVTFPISISSTEEHSD